MEYEAVSSINIEGRTPDKMKKNELIERYEDKIDECIRLREIIKVLHKDAQGKHEYIMDLEDSKNYYRRLSLVLLCIQISFSLFLVYQAL